MVMLLRVLGGVGLLFLGGYLGYYIGREVGRGEHIRERLRREREQSKPAADGGTGLI